MSRSDLSVLNPQTFTGPKRLSVAAAFFIAASQPALGQVTDASVHPPRSVSDIACPPPMTVSPEMAAASLRPSGASPPVGQEMSEAIRERIQELKRVDPYGLCVFRDANARLSAASNRVIFLGDSITAGWQAGAPTLFMGEVIDRGIPGQNTSQMLLRFRNDVLDLHPAVLHIMAGINDINTPIGTAITRANIQSMVELARANRITVVLGSITPSSEFRMFPELQPATDILALNAWMERYAADNSIIYVDYHTPLADAQGGIRPEYSNEGLHPNQRGYDVMTPLAENAVREALTARKEAAVR